MKKLNMEQMPDLPYAMEEAVNRLRINIGFLGNDIRKIMVISTMPNEGKSFVTMNLWYQMAQAGTSSILADTDLRKSVMVEKYGMTVDGEEKIQGTSHYLAGDQKLEDVILHTDLEHGDILPNTDNVINPSMLLESKRFEDMLDQLSEKYRYL